MGRKRIEIKPIIGERLKACREEKQWTQSRLAEAAEVTTTLINGIERGIRPLSDRIAAAIAKNLGVDPKYLLGESKYKHAYNKFEADESHNYDISQTFGALLEISLGAEILSNSHPDILNKDCEILGSLFEKYPIGNMGDKEKIDRLYEERKRLNDNELFYKTIQFEDDPVTYYLSKKEFDEFEDEVLDYMRLRFKKLCKQRLFENLEKFGHLNDEEEKKSPAGD